MAKYERGHAGGPGRPRGVRSLKKFLRATAVMEREGVHPVTELIKIAQTTKDEYLKVQIWTLLQEYSEAKPKPVETENVDDAVMEGEYDTATLEAIADDVN
jgi:hypothetical protein